MNVDIWFLIIVAFLCGVIVLYLAVYFLGYRFTRTLGRKTPGKSISSDSPAPPQVNGEPSLAADAIKLALSEIDDGVIITSNNYRVRYMNGAAMSTLASNRINGRV